MAQLGLFLVPLFLFSFSGTSRGPTSAARQADDALDNSAVKPTDADYFWPLAFGPLCPVPVRLARRVIVYSFTLFQCRRLGVLLL